MPTCEQKELNEPHSGYLQCHCAATTALWCPTWISAENGPMQLCDRHADHFRKSEGEWHWGADAYDAFNKAKAQGIPTPQEQFKRWLNKGK